MNFVDLHTHSTISDGTFTPSELVDYAVKKNLSAIALTDHDTVAGIPEALKASLSQPIELISGIEISSDFNGKEIHVIGLYVDYTDSSFINSLALLKAEREARNLKVINKLNSLSIPISMEDLLNLTNNNASIITRSHFAKLLVKLGYATSISDAFNKYLGDGRCAYIKRELPSVEKACDIIRQSGGIAILAHPYLYKFGSDNFKKLLFHIASVGFTGVECYYSTHTPAETNHLLSLIKDYNLLPSGGSDFHGDNKPNLDLGVGYGKLQVPYSILENLKGCVKHNG